MYLSNAFYDGSGDDYGSDYYDFKNDTINMTIDDTIHNDELYENIPFIIFASFIGCIVFIFWCVCANDCRHSNDEHCCSCLCIPCFFFFVCVECLIKCFNYYHTNRINRRINRRNNRKNNRNMIKIYLNKITPDSNLDKIMKKETCSICFENHDNNSVSLNCGHSFHTTCIVKWLEENNTCPLCRAEVYKNEPIKTPTIYNTNYSSDESYESYNEY